MHGLTQRRLTHDSLGEHSELDVQPTVASAGGRQPVFGLPSKPAGHLHTGTSARLDILNNRTLAANDVGSGGGRNGDFNGLLAK